MESSKTVEYYIEKHPNRRDELKLLRNILNESELVECVKWGAPCYTLQGKNVIGLASFKTYVGLWFHQGVFLSDPKKKLVNAQEGTTKALRQWRFNNINDIDTELVRQYVAEAIQNQKKGKEIKAVKAKKVDIPIELAEALQKNARLNEKFKLLTPGKQREYYEHIATAKQEKTRLSRLEKSIPLILDRKGLHDKYKT